MSRRIVVALFASGVPLALAGCGLAEVAGPNRGVANITIVLPSTLLVGDTVQATVVLTNAKGKPPLGDSTLTWRSSDAASVSVDARGRVTGNVVGAHATISASAGKATSSVAVSVGDDQRLGYALADQPTAADYVPDANFRFSSSSGTIQITRASDGVYAVRFAGLGRTVGQRDNVQVTGNSGAGGIFCKLGGWQSIGSDLTAEVRCFTPAGVPADSRYSILLSGARVYNPFSRLGFALSPDFAGASVTVQLDTSATTRNNSATQVVQMGRSGLGQYYVQFPGLERIAGTPTQGPDHVEVTAVGAGPERCHIAAIDASHASMGVSCVTTGGVAADARFSILYLQRGRRMVRFGYGLADQQSSTQEYSTNPFFTRSPTGDVTARLITTGQYRVTFQGLARGQGDTDTILLTPNSDHICSTTSWANSGADFAVTLSCFNVSGTLANTQFFILLIE